MNLQEVIDSLQLKLLTEKKDFSTIQVTTGYTSDLLSCVMTGAEDQSIWITLMAHSNIIAVASLLDVAAIIITENAQPDENTIARANQQSITLLSTPIPTFNIVGRLWDLGIRGT
ncbi:MAG: DRTGG domain-containing protein [Anaerolineaceae bacterium]|jgi:hypothetical protein|nr:hypothetical protein [Chloroflexota bacterium]HZK17141.1 DRTGG domain-containing protein [Anaerolineaceae bacterium]